MAGITKAQAEARLQAYLDAEAKILAKQRYAIGDRSLQYASLQDVREGIKQWDAMVKRLDRGGIRVVGATPT